MVVTPIAADDVRGLFELRIALEVAAARLAARRRDRAEFERLQVEFRDIDILLADKDRYYDLVARLDDAIDGAVDNPFLVSALDGVRTHVARIRRLSHDDDERLREAAREHRYIVDAIVEGEESLAAHATELHLHRSLTNILSSLERNAE
jgi:DNA-binding GntR family transcriptional regulator